LSAKLAIAVGRRTTLIEESLYKSATVLRGGNTAI
jgi:hypothetical protein